MAIITNPVSQQILSSKHLLTTTSETINFNKEFETYFSLVANEISLNANSDVNLSDYSLLIIKENIVSINDLDEGEINEFMTIFHVRNNLTGEIIEMFGEDSKELYISPDLKDIMKKIKPKEMSNLPNSKDIKDDTKKDKPVKVYDINMVDIPDDMTLFLVQIGNSELTRPLYSIMGLLDTKERRRELGINDINDLAQAMLDSLIEARIPVMSVHAEVLLTPLVRSIEDVLSRPDFKRYDAMMDTQLLTVSAALEKHPSVLIGLSFQFLGRQLLNPLTFKKTGESFLDPFFREQP